MTQSLFFQRQSNTPTKRFSNNIFIDNFRIIAKENMKTGEGTIDK